MLSARFLWIALAASLAAHAQDNSGEAKARQLQALLKQAPQLPLKKVTVTIQAPRADFIVGRIVSVALDRRGVAYVLHRGNQADPVIAVDRNGKVLRSWGKGMFLTPHSIKVDPAGNVWTTDAGSSAVIKFSPEGKKLEEFVLGDTPTGKDCAYLPSPANGNMIACGTTDIAFAPDGRLVITDGYGKMRILLYSADGKRIHEWGGPGEGPGQFHVPHGLALDGKNIIYVADREGARIQRFDLDGRYLGEWSSLGKAGAIRFVNGAVWAAIRTLEPASQTPGAGPSIWVIKIDPASGKIVGKIETTGTDFIEVSDTGDVLAGATTGGFFWYRQGD